MHHGDAIDPTDPSYSLEAKAKITNKMNHVIALHEATLVNPLAVPLMLDSEGNIAETHLGNFFFVLDGKLCTPTDKNVLGGITRTTLFNLADDLGIPVVEGNFTPYDIYSADEASRPAPAPRSDLSRVSTGTYRRDSPWSGHDCLDQGLESDGGYRHRGAGTRTPQ